MKRIAFLLAITFLLTIPLGCSDVKSPDLPVKFYYPNTEISYGTEDGFLSFESREGNQKSTEVLLNDYLRGPSDSTHLNPFPQNTELVEYQFQNGTFYLILTDSYATMSGLDLSIANACLALTVFALTEAVNVSIQCQSSQIDGQTAIVLSRNSVLLYDSSKSTTPTESIPSVTIK